MGLLNLIIAMAVAVVMFVGAGMTFHYRMLEQHAEMEANPYGSIVNPPVKGSGLAALPKWDDKNWKGLTHKPGGVFQSKNANAASKPNAARVP